MDVRPNGNLVVEAHRRGVAVLLLDATLQPRSWRSRWPARALYRAVYERLSVISAVTDADAVRFRMLVPDHPALSVDGDTRYDQVQQRRQASRRVALAPDLVSAPRPFTLVAGSTSCLRMKATTATVVEVVVVAAVRGLARRRLR